MWPPCPLAVAAECPRGARPFGLACVPESALSCEPYAADAEALDCVYAHGMWRVTHDGQVAMGTGADHTLYWPSGCEVPLLVIHLPFPGAQLAPLTSHWTTQATSARVDGSELFELGEWGTLELWPAEPHVRAGWAALAPVRDATRAFVTVVARANGTYEVSYVREDKLRIWRVSYALRRKSAQ